MDAFQPAEKSVEHCVYIMNDWTPGQFYILEPQYQPTDEYLLDLCHTAFVALECGLDELTPYAKEVAATLLSRIPEIIQKHRQKEEIKRSRKPTYGQRAGYVYLLQSSTGHYKIGRTRNPEDRLRTFGVMLPFEVEYVCVIQTPDMFKLESDLHNLFSQKRVSGEWFSLDNTDVDHIKGLAS